MTRSHSRFLVLSILASSLVVGAAPGCSSDDPGGSDAGTDSAAGDAAGDARADAAGKQDSAPPTTDAGSDARTDGSASDASTSDARTDSSVSDSSVSDSSVSDSSVSDSSVSDANGSDTGISDAGGDGAAAFKSFTSTANWESVTVQPAGQASPISGFFGAVFDGRYLYLVPNGSFHGRVVRYDTTASFSAAASYAMFDVATVDAAATGFKTGAFDGRYVYLTQGHPGGRMARYDTQAAFGTATSWEFMNPTTISASLSSFWQSTAFDGRYVYYGPFQSMLLRYDTQASFTAVGSWSFIDGTTINGAVSGLSGIVFDGTHVNFFGGASLRIPANGDFTNTAAWETNGSGAGAYGVYDGQFIWTGPASGGIGFQYNPQGTPYPSRRSYVTGAGSASVFGGVTDGKFLFFAPSSASKVVRIDPSLVYLPDGGTGSGSATNFDLTTAGVTATDFKGAAFDGRYVYLVPGDHSTLVRFDAKEPKSMPASYKGSFL